MASLKDVALVTSIAGTNDTVIELSIDAADSGSGFQYALLEFTHSENQEEKIEIKIEKWDIVSGTENDGTFKVKAIFVDTDNDNTRNNDHDNDRSNGTGHANGSDNERDNDSTATIHTATTTATMMHPSKFAFSRSGQRAGVLASVRHTSTSGAVLVPK